MRLSDASWRSSATRPTCSGARQPPPRLLHLPPQPPPLAPYKPLLLVPLVRLQWSVSRETVSPHRLPLLRRTVLMCSLPRHHLSTDHLLQVNRDG
ncbi:hypothetical protein DPMN_176294 [Dreissena polymorpha]|uniref:Uncharacterized protein n=1 Tax=Dreissena polymorpha TaxID=45954 RepID=A0A9D4EAP5_DREPO|nr:hypothetical protein DPMN_176294 [Dreissena polymorpha]